MLLVQNVGTGLGQIGVQAGSITFGGLAIASFTGGTTNDATLEFTFNANANVAGIQALIENLTFAIEPSDSTNLTRVIELTLDDGGGLASAPVTLSIVINHQPSALPYHTATGTNAPLAISFARLLLNCSDPDGNPITITQVESNSAAGGVVTTNQTGLIYTPATNYVGADQFAYFISDGRTGTNTGTVSVAVLSGNSLAIVDSLTNLIATSQAATLGIEGVPDLTYQVQASNDLLLWSQIGSVTIPADGFTNYVDINAINNTNRFYRTVYP